MAIKVANNQSLTAITALPAAVSGGAMTLLETQTASSSSTIDFTSGIDSTYKEYVFKFTDVHPATNNVYFSFQGNAAGGADFNETITSTFFRSGNNEADNDAFLSYDVSNDQAQGTAFQNITRNIGNGNDECSSGTLRIFNPADGTFVKHFIARFSSYIENDQMVDLNVAGYFNTTTALTRVQFKFNSGNIDAGDICLYGIN